MSQKKFDLNYVYVQFTACFETSPKLDMESYIKAYTEYNKFFGLLGTVFGFVSSDVVSKLELLQDYLKGPNGNNFATVEQMLDYESKEKLLDDPKYVSGSRTLLRLHRALMFIAMFLESMVELKPDDKLTHACQEAYKATLGHYHPWIIQKAALVAMYALPTRHGLLNRIKSPEETEEHYVELIPKVVAAMKQVYDRTQKFYEERHLLELP